jgi:nucleotide-binding universal stress UspA family protein
MKTILAATDFSKPSLNAVRYAAELAVCFNAKLTLLHVSQFPVVSDVMMIDTGVYWDEIVKADEASITKLETDLKKKHGDALRVNHHVQVGFTLEVIRKKIGEGDVGLLVMGIGHLDNFSKVVFGSTSANIGPDVRCPVLIVPDNSRFRPWKKIGFAFDLKHIPQGSGLKTLATMRNTFNSDIQYVHVHDDVNMKLDEKTLIPLFKIFKQEDTRVHYLDARRSKVIDVLRDWTRRYKINALVMVARHHTVLWRMMHERQTKKMALETTVPLLIISEPNGK